VLREGKLKSSGNYHGASEQQKKSVKQGLGVFYMKIKSDFILSTNIKSLSQIKEK
jgi:hypothetical protein